MCHGMVKSVSNSDSLFWGLFLFLGNMRNEEALMLQTYVQSQEKFVDVVVVREIVILIYSQNTKISPTHINLHKSGLLN